MFSEQNVACASNYYSEKEPKYVALFFGRDIFFSTLGGIRDRKKEGDIVEIVQNQKDGRQIVPSRSPLKNFEGLRGRC